MYYLQTKASFDAAHFLWKYEGKCKNIHGHRWNVVAKIKSTGAGARRTDTGNGSGLW